MPSCKAPAFARMNRRVALQARTQASDGQGGFTESWTTLGTVWASIEPLKSYERMLGSQLQAERTHKITIRYASYATHAARILWDGRAFDVKEVINPEERNAMLVIRAAELTV